MEINRKEIKLAPSLMGMDYPEAIIAPLGDLQYGAMGADLDKFKRHVDWCMEHNAYFIGMGDMVDVASPSGRMKIVNAGFYESIIGALEDHAEQAMNVVLDVLKGTEERWLGMHRGHHYWDFGTDIDRNHQTTDTLMAAALNTPYLDWSALTVLTFDSSGQECQIHSTHGSGSSVTMSGPLLKLEKRSITFPEVDIFLEGHCARKAGYPKDALVTRNGQLYSKRRIFALTGGFAKGYLVGKTTYVEDALMTPLNLGAPLIFVRPVDAEGRLDLNLSL